jgi:lysophospholipase L1-like esterase
MKKRVVACAAAMVSAVGVFGVVAPSAHAAGSTTTSIRLMPLGASFTEGYLSSTGNGYRGPLWESLTTEGHPLDFVGSSRDGSMADPDNEGHSGYRIDQVAALTDAALAKYKPNVVVLQVGTNDLAQQYQLSTAPARLSALVDQILNDDPTATVIMGSMYVSTNTVINQGWASYNAAIKPMVASKQAAGKHVEYADLSAITTADLADDRHPNDVGYALAATAFNTQIQAAASSGWIVLPVANGAATAGPSAAVTSGVAGKCLDDTGAGTADGTKIEIWSCNGGSAQKWTAYSDGTLRVQGKCLDAKSSGLVNGTLVQLYTCNGTGAQLWQSSNGGYRNVQAGRCLDDPGFSAVDGTQLALWDCNGGANQKWSTLSRD